MDYTPERDGVIIAVRLFLEENTLSPLAEVMTVYGKRKIIRWDSVENRALYGKGITSSTVYYDERTTMDFSDLARLV